LIPRKEPVPITYVDERKEPIIEEKPKEEVEIKKEIEEEILEKRVPEEIIPEEKVPEEKIEIIPEEKVPEEKIEVIPEERISEEMKEERIVVEKKNVAVQTDDDISSSESVYSYSVYITFMFRIILLLQMYAFECAQFISQIIRKKINSSKLK